MRLSYLLPLRREVAEPVDGDLAGYLRDLAAWMDVVVVDGSPPAVRAGSATAFGPTVTLITPAAEDRCANGKAWGVLTGLRAVQTEGVVIADDDVRWHRSGVEQVAAMLDDVDLVVPQNFFSPLPWHAAWDSGRMLLNRAVAYDWPGTLVLRLAALPDVPAYDGNVLFENCELVRTVRARGGRVLVARTLLVARRPPTVRHFVGQRTRQAYDDLAHPARMAAMLTIVPAALRTGPRTCIAAAVACSALAEVGRRRDGGRRRFPWYTSLCAPLWLGERGVLTWWALCLRATGCGVDFAGVRIVRAATPMRELVRRTSSAHDPRCAEESEQSIPR